MAGKPKTGLDYAGWSVNLFDGDTKIDKLLDAQGWTGFGIYFYLCQMAYKFDGYFYRWAYDDSASTARRMGGGIGSGTVEETVRYCLQIGLFDQGLFDGWGILTSRGIQRRFYAAIQERRRKAVISDYWLLNDEESRGLEKCASYENAPPANEHLPPADGHLPQANAYKSKVKESKGEEVRACARKDPDIAHVFGYYFDHICPQMTQRAADELKAYISAMGPECCIRGMDEAIEGGVLTWKYVKGVLDAKRKQGVKSMEDWDELEKRRNQTEPPTAPPRPAKRYQTVEIDGKLVDVEVKA
mgnify:FL=1|jgi:hypothetical protein